jgi:hypothetical protein
MTTGLLSATIKGAGGNLFWAVALAPTSSERVNNRTNLKLVLFMTPYLDYV